jgi:hypothetical protein
MAHPVNEERHPFLKNGTNAQDRCRLAQLKQIFPALLIRRKLFPKVHLLLRVFHASYYVPLLGLRQQDTHVYGFYPQYQDSSAPHIDIPSASAYSSINIGTAIQLINCFCYCGS